LAKTKQLIIYGVVHRFLFNYFSFWNFENPNSYYYC
jgi:hypothetical protein